MTAQGVGQLHFPSCLIPTLPVMGVVGHTIDSCIMEPCDPNADCTRGVGFSVTCTCRPPFTVGDGFSCSSNYCTVVFSIGVGYYC